MGTFKAIGQVKGWIRRCAAGLYALSPRYLEPLRGKVIILTYHRVVSKKELKTVHGIPYSFAHIARLEKSGQFPKRIRLGACRVAWWEDEVEDWKTSRPRAA